jgi:two-component system response regulator PilR (NtrC family)
MQVKLLRVIQEKAVRPVGESREQPVDVRVLSATHKNLTQLVSQGRFREDLYYRINVIEIRVPALREHAEDIPELADALLQRLAKRNGAPSARITAEARDALKAYSFAGNVRELENVLERAVALSASGVLGAADLQLRTPMPSGSTGVETIKISTDEKTIALFSDVKFSDLGASEPGSAAALGHQLEAIERDAIIRALGQTRYNKTAAAKLLGMSFRALRYRVKKLGIE